MVGLIASIYWYLDIWRWPFCINNSVETLVLNRRLCDFNEITWKIVIRMACPRGLVVILYLDDGFLAITDLYVNGETNVIAQKL